MGWHESYLAHRESIEHVEEIAGITAGGMPTRVTLPERQLARRE